MRSTAWCEASGLPVAAGWRCQDYVDNTSAAYVGSPRSRARTDGSPQRVREADVLLVIGDRLGDITTGGYTLLDVRPTRGRR